jgi:hypothetical protein
MRPCWLCGGLPQRNYVRAGRERLSAGDDGVNVEADSTAAIVPTRYNSAQVQTRKISLPDKAPQRFFDARAAFPDSSSHSN